MKVNELISLGTKMGLFHSLQTVEMRLKVMVN
jgi:hypothetical protein